MFLLLGLACWMSVASCTSEEKKQEKAEAEMAEDHAETADEMNDAKFDGDKEDDATFLAHAAQTNLLEIELGRLAQKNATSEQVRELGKEMETAHAKAQEDLVALAAKKQVTLPEMMSEDGTECYQKLVKKTGTEFEREYCDKTVDGHEKTLKKFERASDKAEDAEIKGWATSMLPELRAHLEHATTCKKNVKEKS